MNDSKKADHKSRILLFLEIGGDLATAAAKFFIGILGNSSAMIAEGFHSLADTTNQIFLLIGVENSKRAADHNHPFGYGKERFFWAFLSALFIMIVSGGIAIYQGVDKVINPSEVSDFELSFLVLGVALVFQFFNLFFSNKHYRFLVGKEKSLKERILSVDIVREPTAINLWLGDIAAVFGNILAALSLYFVWLTGNSVYDGLASVLIGILLVGLGLYLAQDTKRLLVGEAVSPGMYEKIISIIRSFDEVKSIVNLKTMHLTPNEILINSDIDFKENLSTHTIDKAIDKIETEIKKQIPAAKHISIEVERSD